MNPDSADPAWMTAARSDRLGIFLRRLRSQWRPALSVLLGAVAVSVILAFALPSWWRVEITVVPVTRSPSGLGGLGAGSISGLLGGLAGVGSLLGHVSSNEDEALAVLGSRELFDTYATKENLLPILYSDDWDGTANKWTVTGSSIPTLRRAYRLFNRSIRDISLDRRSGIVTMGITWEYRDQAVKWAKDLIALTNAQLRERAIDQATEDMRYLSAEIGKARGENASNALTMALANAYERSLQDYMFAKGQEEFAFRVIDPPTVPDARERVWPQRVLFIVIGFVGGSILAIFVVRLHEYWTARSRHRDEPQHGLVLTAAHETA